MTLVLGVAIATIKFAISIALPTLQNSSFVHSIGSVNSLPFPSYSSLVPPRPLPFPYDFPISFVLHHDQPPQVPNQIQVVATHPQLIQVVPSHPPQPNPSCDALPC